MSYIDEAQVEIVTVEYFRELGYESGKRSGWKRWKCGQEPFRSEN